MTPSSSDIVDRISDLDPALLYAVWRGRDKDAWRDCIELYARIGERFLGLGEPLLAFDAMDEALTFWPADVRLQIMQARALARCGATERSNAMLQNLYQAGQRDEETIGNLASTHKDLWLASNQWRATQYHLEACEALYAEAYEKNKGYWSGINVATFSLLNGNTARAELLSREVEKICRHRLDTSVHGNAELYWIYATLGEASLILGSFDEASGWYKRARDLPDAGFGKIASTRRNAKLLLSKIPADAGFLGDCLPAPHVVLFAGHMIDLENRRPPRFPPESELRVYSEIRNYLAEHRTKVGFSSAACGADLIFLEAMLEGGGEINVVLPSAPETFMSRSVNVVPGWSERFERVMQRATKVVRASEESTGDVFLMYANIMLCGLARSRVRQIDGELSALAVWDGNPGEPGGTASAVKLWRDCGEAVHVIHPLTLGSCELRPSRRAVTLSDTWQSSLLDRDDVRARRLVSMLFADAVGFSRLKEEHIPRFVKHFLGTIAELLEKTTYVPIVRNTWGDALYFVFDDVRAAGLLALDVCDLIGKTDWAMHGLPAELGIRIGLHSGPAYPVTDPIIKQFNYTGVHVSRAARIEPITPPGAVYASEQFAALAEAEGILEFSCEYVGQTSLAKNYGQFPTYRVRRIAQPQVPGEQVINSRLLV
jgi:class 3 adenylate cyclase/tetratricopeptide (TPR) repeat protein